MLLRLKGKIAVLLCAFLLLFVFSVCSLNIDSGESRQLCEEFLDHVINNDYDAAYGMISEACTEDEARFDSDLSFRQRRQGYGLHHREIRYPLKHSANREAALPAHDSPFFIFNIQLFTKYVMRQFYI